MVMDKRIRTEWVKALRSGEYSQTKYTLQDKHGFCCLGVLCDLYSKEKGEKWEEILSPEDNPAKIKRFHQLAINISNTIATWAKLSVHARADLIEMNDVNGKTFDEIADYIEENL